MARVSKKSVMNNVRGSLGKELVFKKYGNKTVVTKYPDMSQVKYTPLQQVYQGGFAEAVAYAQSIVHNPKEKAKYAKKLKKGASVYHAAIKEYLKKNKPKKG